MFRIDFKGIDKKLFSKIDTRKQKLIRRLTDQQPIWVLYLDVIKFSEVEFRHGYKICNFILEELESEIKQTLKQQRNLFQMSYSEGRGGDDFVIYFIPGDHTPWRISDLIREWVTPLENRLNRKIEKWVKEEIKLRASIVPCTYTSGRSADYLIYAAVKEAFYLNKAEPDALYFAHREEVTRLLTEPNHYLKSAFQPIIHVPSGDIYGYEALARVNGETTFNHIGELFPFAEKIGKLYAIETLCRRKAISSAPSVLRKNELLFLNINPQVLSDPEFATGQTRKLLDIEGLHPWNVVLEITEQSAIKDFPSFREALAHYRNQGYLIALDDVGAGYSSLQSIAELHPDFLKIDRSLINEINKNPAKWALLETFVNFSKRIGCRILAEGVETEEEMRTVVQLGVDFVQGFFVAKPQFERVPLNQQALDIIKLPRKTAAVDNYTIRSLVEPLPLFDAETLVKTIDDFFRNHPNEWLIGITEKTRISGALKREKLDAALSTRYGASLYPERSISQLMDKAPLIVEDTTPVEVVARLAMERPNAQLYDGIIVTNQRKPVGKICISSLLSAMTDRQIRMDHEAIG